jgi:hypothetical protein
LLDEGALTEASRKALHSSKSPAQGRQSLPSSRHPSRQKTASTPSLVDECVQIVPARSTSNASKATNRRHVEVSSSLSVPVGVENSKAISVPTISSSPPSTSPQSSEECLHTATTSNISAQPSGPISGQRRLSLQGSKRRPLGPISGSSTTTNGSQSKLSDPVSSPRPPVRNNRSGSYCVWHKLRQGRKIPIKSWDESDLRHTIYHHTVFDCGDNILLRRGPLVIGPRVPIWEA